MAIALCDLRPLTKTLPVPQQANNNWLQQRRIFRSADNSPATFRHLDRPRTARGGPRTLNSTYTQSIEEEESNNNNSRVAAVRPVRTQNPAMDPILRFEQEQRQLEVIPPQNRQFMTYAETRARLRERRPIQRVPVAQAPQQEAQHQTRRRSRARTLRNHLLRRTEQQNDQQSLLQHAHLDNINEPEQRAEGEQRRTEEEEQNGRYLIL